MYFCRRRISNFRAVWFWHAGCYGRWVASSALSRFRERTLASRNVAVRRRGFESDVNATEHPRDWSELGARVLEVATAATLMHIKESASSNVEHSAKETIMRADARDTLSPE